MAVKTVCPYCGVGCGVIVETTDVGTQVRGDPDHPANFGRLCLKGTTLGETLGAEQRLLTPSINGRASTWQAAINKTAQQFSAAIKTHGPDSVAIYASGQMLTEDYYVANKLMKGFVGSANIDTNSRLCMASTVAGHMRAFGADTVPGNYEDLELADLVVLVGSNLAWCHPVLYQRIVAAKQARPNMHIVNIDPRNTVTCDLADNHLAITPGGDVALFAGLLRYLSDTNQLNQDYLNAHVNGLQASLAAAQTVDLSNTGLSATQCEDFFSLWANTQKVVTVFSQGVNQSVDGTDKVNSIINVHLATGRIGRPGMGPFSVTGQPNAMGGREVGGLANMLAGHLDINNPEHRKQLQDFWQAPNMVTGPGMKAVDLFAACGRGEIKALWIISTNPVVSLPEADSIVSALQTCPFVAVSEMSKDSETVAYADVVFPAAAWGEKSGTVTNSERCISRQRAFLPAIGEARPDWQIICDVAAAMGWQKAFAYRGPEDIFYEYADMTRISSLMGRDLDLSGLADADYDNMLPVYWPVYEDEQKQANKEKAGGRFFAEGDFFTPDRRATMVPTIKQPMAQITNKDWPLRLNTGRVRDQWHTMTRTATASRLNVHIAEPFVEIHPQDAQQYAITSADIVRVESQHGYVLVRAWVTEATPAGAIFLPMHWNGVWASRGKVDTLVRADTDPYSGQPALKGSVARIKKSMMTWYGFAVSVKPFKPATSYWAKASAEGGWRAEMAHETVPEDWLDYGRDLLQLPEQTVLSVQDDANGIARLVFHDKGRILAALFVAPEPALLSRSYVVAGLSSQTPARELLAGMPAAGKVDPGPTLCSCFAVGVNTIVRAIAEQELNDISAIGIALNAGTNCGSCRPELSALLAKVKDTELIETVTL